MAIGLIMQAVGMAAQMAGSAVKNNDFVEKTSTYTPTGFSEAGLYNNALGDLGQVDTYQNVSEEKGLKKGLMGLGTALGVAAPMVDSLAEGAGGPKRGRAERKSDRALRRNK